VKLMRLASESENFPFELATVCYIEVGADGGVTSPPEEHVQDRVRRGESRLYAVWPGHYRSDLFLIDDIDEYEKALGLQHDPVRTGLQEHKHQVRWSISPCEDRPTGAYVSVEARLDCGCEVKDLKTFARHMRDQRGWDIATTAAWETSSPTSDAHARPTYTFRIRRRSLA
jgi:hypothetical protein